IKSVIRLNDVKLPFATDGILTARINLPRTDYPDSAACVRFYETLLPRLQAIPAVESATLSDGLPGAGNGTNPVQIEGATYRDRNDYPSVREAIVTPGYFETFQARVLAGREFTTADTGTSPAVAVVNDTFARTYFSGADPLGRRFRRGRGDASAPWLTVVGVVPDLLMQGIGNSNQSPAGYYIPIAQSDVTNFVTIALRTRANGAAMLPLVRQAVASLNPDLAIFDARGMDEVIRRQTWFYRVFGVFFMAFGCCALALAAAGLYGVVSFAVTQRAREMGVRSALGASGALLVGLVLRRSLVQLAIGLTIGVLLALAATGPLQTVLYGVKPQDPAVIATVVVVLAATSLLASFLPARRVTRIDPMIVMTGEN